MYHGFQRNNQVAQLINISEGLCDTEDGIVYYFI